MEFVCSLRHAPGPGRHRRSGGADAFRKFKVRKKLCKTAVRREIKRPPPKDFFRAVRAIRHLFRTFCMRPQARFSHMQHLETLLAHYGWEGTTLVALLLAMWFVQLRYYLFVYGPVASYRNNRRPTVREAEPRCRSWCRCSRRTTPSSRSGCR